MVAVTDVIDTVAAAIPPEVGVVDEGVVGVGDVGDEVYPPPPQFADMAITRTSTAFFMSIPPKSRHSTS